MQRQVGLMLMVHSAFSVSNNNVLDVELHQITASPESAPDLLDRLLKTTARVSKNTDDALQFGEFVARSWVSIARAKGAPI